MNLSSKIRAELKGTKIALTCAEVADAISENSGDVSKLLYAMVQRGEIERIDNEGSRPAYLYNSEYALQERGTKSPANKIGGKKSAAPKPQKALRTQARELLKSDTLATTAIAAVKAATTGQSNQLIHINRGTVRKLIAFAMGSEEPLDASTRQAVIDATREAA